MALRQWIVKRQSFIICKISCSYFLKWKQKTISAEVSPVDESVVSKKSVLVIWDKTPSPYQLHLPSSSPPRHTQTYTTPSQNIPWYTLRLWVLCEASLKFDFKDLQGLCQKSVRVSNLCWINDQTHKGCLWFRFSERGLVLVRALSPRNLVEICRLFRKCSTFCFLRARTKGSDRDVSL